MYARHDGLALRDVSIRARHCWRAMAGARGCVRLDARVFQSAPAIAGGRCAAPGAHHRRLHVSIRARHCWRAMASSCPQRTTPAPFQSAPAIAGGRCGAQVLRLCQGPVSIRARHCWRAMHPVGDGRSHHLDVSIRARHCWRAMVYSLREALADFKFQSAPAIAGGRCCQALLCIVGLLEFQSAPAIAGGR